MSANWKSRIPWPVKVAAKVALSRLPVSYHVWSRLNLFKHGFMTDPAYAERVFLEHFAELDPAVKKRAYTCLELGPGDSLLSAVVAHKYGAGQVYLVDVGPFAEEDIAVYRQAASTLLAGKETRCKPSAWSAVSDMLECCNARYLTDGVASLTTIPTGSVDFIWSQAVLEHVRVTEFREMLRQTRRILRDGGSASHRVDLRDHLGGKLNNLRFSDQLWERPGFANSGFYTNRLRYSEILAVCRDAGFTVKSTRLDEWDTLPTPRSVMATRFRNFSDADLRIQGFYIHLSTS